ncbi:MAG: hypothetical protein U0Z26_19230 [Anaerolineales bacterium]
MQIDIIGVHGDLGADRRGVDMVPKTFAIQRNRMEELGYTVQMKAMWKCRLLYRVRLPIQT